MPQICQKPLKINPFMTYRHTQTGEWMVINPPVLSPVACGATTYTQADPILPNPP